MKIRHTPGPWTSRLELVDVAHHPNKAIVIAAGPMPLSDVIALVVDEKGTIEQGGCARLIAAAPDLVEVVRQVVLWDMSKNIGRRKPAPLFPHIVDAARAALEKAGV